MSHKNIFAYTEPTQPAGFYVGYVSLNENGDDGVSLTVRSPDSTGRACGTCIIPLADLKNLSEALTEYLSSQTVI